MGTTVKDQLVYGGTDEEKPIRGVDVTKEGDYLFISASEATSGNKIFVKSLTRKMPRWFL